MSTTAGDRLPSSPRIRVIAAQKLTTLTLVAATFFIVSGGPFGLEELIANAGYLRSMMVLLLVPILWGIPTALMVSELSAAIPQDGGFYVWVTRAMGPFWGFQEAWLSLASSIFDMALYPTVFVLYASRIFPVLENKGAGVLVGAALVVACTAWNLSGVRKVGNSAVVMGVILLAPFLALAAFIYFAPGRWHAAPGGAREGTLLTGVLVAMWNFMGWDNASTVAGEVENPQRTYVRAMFYASLLVTLSYLIPVGACWLGGVDPSAWSTGAWAEVGNQVGGRWLSLGIVVAGVIFGVGMLNSCTMSYTRVPYAMAVDGWLPKPFTNLNRHGVPWVSVLACAVAWVAALSLGFVKLIELDVSIYGLSLVLEFIALIVLRIKEPGLSRPFRVPGGMVGAVLIGIGPMALVALAVLDSYHQHITYFGFTLNNLALSGAVILLGFAQYLTATRKRRVKPSPQAGDQRLTGLREQ